jgi:peptidyl-prolyl cis-trans isomerase C
MSTIQQRVIIIVFCLFVIFLPGCTRNSPVTTGTSAVAATTLPPGVTQVPSQTPVPPTPSPTPIPLAAVVNGEPITLAEFQAELERFQATTPLTGTILASDPNMIVLNELIDQTLFAQGAVESGFVVDDTTLQSRIEALENQLGSSQALEDWISEHGYFGDDFRLALRRSVSVAWMRDQIIAEVPETAEEVHVWQILLPTSAEANDVYASLQSGADFFELAVKYDPSTGGDLGWFPRGYLDDPAIEEAAFALQPDQYSPVVETDIGFHILYLVERDPNHRLQPGARSAYQERALLDWISERRNQSTIQILLP